MIKNAGFDCVMTNADERLDKQNGTIKEQVKLFKENGLKHSSLHMSYLENDLPYFWKNCKIGNNLEKSLKKDVKIAKKYKFTCVVVHVIGEKSEIGIKRLTKILKLCNKLNIPLALENLENNEDLLDYVFENITDKQLKFCYDSGHNNAFSKDIDFLKKYSDKLITLHLHDNMGEVDEHTLNKYGNIDWKNIALNLANINPNINLDYEILMYGKSKYDKKKETAENVIKETFQQACDLEKTILDYLKCS